MANGINKWCVYIHITPNNKYYVGITSQSPIKRWQYGLGYRKQPLFNNAIQKYGWDNIEHKILRDNLTESQSKRLEVELISKLKSHRTNGYNLTDGGEGTKSTIMSIETREKISQANKGRSINTGASNGMYGKSGLDCPTSKRVLCIDSNKEFDSLKLACNSVEIKSCSSMSEAIKNSTRCRGMYWRYI